MMTLFTRLGQKRARQRELSAHAGNLCLRYFTRFISLATLVGLGVFFLDNTEYMIIATSVVAALLALYFGFLLLRRLQCTLLDYCLILVVLGNCEGYLLTIRGLTANVVATCGVAAAIAAWIFYGAAIGIAQATLLRVPARRRPLYILARWFTLAGPALVALGLCGVVCADDFRLRSFVGAHMALYGYVGTGLGVAALALETRLMLRTVRAARAILDVENKPAAPSAAPPVLVSP